MQALYDAPGRQRWITVTEDAGTRFLLLDDCEEGAIHVDSDEPVFEYLWFHKCSVLADCPPRRLLVLGAGTFTAARGLALEHPAARVEVIDPEPDLLAVGREFFRLDRPEFAGIEFHGVAAEEFLASAASTYAFIHDDVFLGFQHVPAACQGREHFQRLRQALADGGLCLKNMIWDPDSPAARAACAEAAAALRDTFANHAVLALGDRVQGHNLLLIGSKSPAAFDWAQARPRLAQAGVPEHLLQLVRPAQL